MIDACESILLVEPDTATIGAIVDALENAGRPGGLGLVPVRDPGAAVPLLAASADRFDLLLISQELPDTTGLAFCRYLQTSGLLLPMILMASEGDIHLPVAALRAGLADFIWKDPQGAYFGELPQILNDACRRHGRQRGRADMERAFRLGEKRFRVFAQAASDRFWEMGPDGRITRAFVLDNDGTGSSSSSSSGAAGSTGSEGGRPHDVLDFLVGRTFEEIGSDTETRHQAKVIADQIGKRTSFRNLSLSHRAPTRLSCVHLRLSGQPIIAEDGTFLGYRGTATDVTGEVEARKAAAEAQARLSEAVETMPAAFLLFAADRQLLLWNSRTLELFREARLVLRTSVTLEELSDIPLFLDQPSRAPVPDAKEREGGTEETKGPSSGWALSHASVLSPLARVATWLRRVQEGETSPDSVLELQTADDRYLRVGAHPTTDGGIVAVVSDITTLKEREHELRLTKEAAEQANLAKSKFLAAASHDLRQPLHAFGLLLTSLANRVKEPEAQHILQRLESALESTQSMFNALLDVSRLDAGVLVAEPKNFALEPLFAQIESEFGPIARDKGLQLRVRHPVFWVYSDPMLLDRILRNLVSNAIRYTARGGVMLAARPRGDRAEIQVWDTGLGIPREHQQEIFDEFHRLGKPTGDSRVGLGLGLSIVKRLSGMLQHPLRLRSESGRGSMFSVEVPLAKRSRLTTAPAPAPAPAASKAKPPAAAAANAPEVVRIAGPRWLVALLDDDPLALDGLQQILSGWSCQVVAASDPDGLIDRLSQAPRRPDLLIVDYDLGTSSPLTGLEAVAKINRWLGLAKPVPALVVTGMVDPVALAHLMESGIPWLTKPVPARALREAMQRVLEEG